MWKCAIAAGIAALLAAPGCGQKERKPIEMASMQNPQAMGSMSATAQNCDLRVAVQASPASLLLGYEFRNRSDKTAFLFNLVYKFGASGGPEADPNLVYVQQSGAAVVLGKKIIPVPDDIDVERPDVPYVTRVDPGEVFREKINIMLPLRPFTPYPQRGGAAVTEAAVYFELGFFLAPDPSVARESGGHLVVYPFAAQKQTILRTGPLGRFPVQPDAQ